MFWPEKLDISVGNVWKIINFSAGTGKRIVLNTYFRLDVSVSEKDEK